jgi:hypothetical protein
MFRHTNSFFIVKIIVKSFSIFNGISVTSKFKAKLFSKEKFKYVI